MGKQGSGPVLPVPALTLAPVSAMRLTNAVLVPFGLGGDTDTAIPGVPIPDGGGGDADVPSGSARTWTVNTTVWFMVVGSRKLTKRSIAVPAPSGSEICVPSLFPVLPVA